MRIASLGISIVCTLSIVASVQAKAPVQRLPISGSLLPAVQRSRVTGAPSPSTVVAISIGLKPRFPAELKAFCDAVSNPISPNYLDFLTPQQVGENFGAAAGDVDNVVAYLKSQGVAVTLVSPNRMAILGRGTIAQLQNAFGTQIKFYQLPTGTARPYAFMANTSAITVPANIAPVIVNVGGLDTFARPVKRTTLTPTLARGLYGAAPAFSAGFLGQGRRIGITNFDSFSIPDAQLFVTTYSLPAPAGGLGSNLHVVTVGTGNGPIDPNIPTGIEGDLDIQMCLSSAPLADIYIYDNAPGDYLGVLTREASDNVADIITESYGWYELPASYAASCHNQHLAMTAQGQTYLAASGDAGTKDMWLPTPDPVNFYPDQYPDEDPDITNVGGTTANTDPVTGARISEVGWTGSGGGWGVIESDGSNNFAFNVLPSWQHGNGVPTNVPHRLVPDIAVQADSGGGGFYMVYNLTTGRGVSGTSCSSPFCAGSLAALEQRLAVLNLTVAGRAGRLGRINDMIYAENGRADVWFDITSGNNSNFNLPDGSQSTAHAGWDYVTGWGAPNFDAWYTALSTRPISGTVTLQNFPAGPSGVAVTVQLYQAGTTTLVDTQTGTLDASGNFTVNSQAPSANYDIYVKASHWLRKKVLNKTFGMSGTSGLTFSLVNGDINGDNTISLADFGKLKLAYGSTSSSGNWNANADLDGNGSVGLSDFGILKLHYGTSGD